MSDLPSARALLTTARDVLLNDLLPLLPPERRLDARLVANCMAIAGREAAAEGAAEPAIGRGLEGLYRSATATHPRPTIRGEAGEGEREPLRCFARDLRIGAFENSPARERSARAILWRLTVARLRRSNPRFLAANGIALSGEP